MPVAPTLPISSLSTSRQQDVFSGASTSSIATREVYAHTRSSWPYARIMLASIPSSRAFPAGTISSSAERKSSSSMPYLSFKSFKVMALTASFSVPSSGWLPIRRSRFSPSTTVFAGFVCCSLERWIRRSVTQNTGSLSSSPITTSTTSPFFFATTPWMASGRVTHCHFLIPP